MIIGFILLENTLTYPDFKLLANWKIPDQSGYAPSFTQGFITTTTPGGLPRLRGATRKQPITISAQYKLNIDEMMDWQNFYEGELNLGANPFNAIVDIGRGNEVLLVELTDAPTFTDTTELYTTLELSLKAWVEIDNVALKATYFSNTANTLQEGLPVLRINSKIKYPSESSYAITFGSGASTTAASGWNSIRKDYEKNPTIVTANYELNSEAEIEEFFNFYYGAINSGMTKFVAYLMIGGEVVSFICQLNEAPSVESWTGYYASITMTMNVVHNPDLLYKACLRMIMNAYGSYDTINEIASILPHPTDSFKVWS